nr:hypothetical protein CFP56_78887 [Quercus suber]
MEICLWRWAGEIMAEAEDTPHAKKKHQMMMNPADRELNWGYGGGEMGSGEGIGGGVSSNTLRAELRCAAFVA